MQEKKRKITTCNQIFSYSLEWNIFSKKLRMFWSKLCKRTWISAWNLVFPVFISPIICVGYVWKYSVWICIFQSASQRPRILLTDNTQRVVVCLGWVTILNKKSWLSPSSARRLPFVIKRMFEFVWTPIQHSPAAYPPFNIVTCNNVE